MVKDKEKYFPQKQGHTYSTSTTFMFYNINSLLHSKYLLTTQLSLWSSSENIHSYVTQPSPAALPYHPKCHATCNCLLNCSVWGIFLALRGDKTKTLATWLH